MAAAGGSYGGYMVNWILGPLRPLQGAGLPRRRLRPPQHGRRNRGTLVLHLGVQGLPVAEPRDCTRSGRPSTYATEFKTPTLVIHGELDYRVPYGQGLQLFTALQAQKVPSKLLALSPTKATGSSNPRTRFSGTRRSSTGSANGPPRNEAPPLSQAPPPLTNPRTGTVPASGAGAHTRAIPQVRQDQYDHPPLQSAIHPLKRPWGSLNWSCRSYTLGPV